MKSLLTAVALIAIACAATTADAGYRVRGRATRPSYASASYVYTPPTGYRTISSYPTVTSYATVSPYPVPMNYAFGYPGGIYGLRATYGYGYYRPYGTYYAPGYGSYSYGNFPGAYAPGYLPPRYYGGVGYWGGVGSGYYYGAGARGY